MPRTIAIPFARLGPWLEGFGSRHGETSASGVGDTTVVLTAADGASATIVVPFPPLKLQDDPITALTRHLSASRDVGALLVRKGGYAVGVFSGSQLLVSKVGSSYVQGKTKAGGWSQQRYARRRDNQSRKAYQEAADEAARILLPHLDTLAAVATGGDKPALVAVLADPRLTGVQPLVLPEVHAVPDPRLRVLQAFPELFLTVRIELNDLA